MIMGRRPSKSFKIIVIVELDDESEFYEPVDMYMIGKRVEKAIDNNTDMIAWIDSIDSTKGR
jgi:hypothetical protein